MDEDYEDMYDDDDSADGAPQWRTLDPADRRKLMKRVFENPDWYDEEQGEPFFQGGMANPLFADISSKVGTSTKEIKRYYAAWLKKRNLNPAIALAPKSNPMDAVAGGHPPASPAPPAQDMSAYMIQDNQQDPMEQMMMRMAEKQPAQQNSDGMGMMFMMNFLTSQQRMAMQQQQFQMMQMMEQRKLDQSRETDQRRESMARDQQFMQQQMAFMRQMMDKSGDDGFFDSDMKKIMKERVVDQLMGGDDSNWQGMVKDVLTSDTMKAAVGGIGTAIGSRSQVPAGYDIPGYNPYAQEVAPNPAPPQALPQQVVYPPAVEQPPQQQLDGVFFEENIPQAPMQEAPPTPVAPPPEIGREEYAKVLLTSFSEMMGAAAQDEHTLAALQEQVDVAVDTTLVEYPDLLPPMKLQHMTEKLVLIRNLREIGMALMDVRSRPPAGEKPGQLILSTIVSELRNNPEFYKIFAENTYDELLAKIAPFKETGAVEVDYAYLIRPEVGEVCRPVLETIRQDSLTNGAPGVPGVQ